MTNVITLSDLSEYSCGIDTDEETEAQVDKPDKMTRLRQNFAKTNTTQRTVRAIILTLDHGHPHVLLLEKKDGTTVIPGGKLSPGEDDDTGIHRILGRKLHLIEGAYEVVELIGMWYRPQFAEQMYPYLPVHITTAKEIESWYLVQLPPSGSLGTPFKYKLSAVPFYDLQDSTHFGKQLSSIPLLISRFSLVPRK